MTAPPDIEELVKRARLKAELFTRFEQPSHANVFSDLASALEARSAQHALMAALKKTEAEGV